MADPKISFRRTTTEPGDSPERQQTTTPPSDSPTTEPANDDAPPVAGSDGGTDSSAAHIDDLIGAEQEAQDAGERAEHVDMGGGVVVDGAGLLSRDAWCKGVATALATASAITSLSSLHTTMDNPVHAEALGAMYDSFRDVPALHFALRPQGKWAGRAIVISAWALPMVKGLQGELRERRAAKRAAKAAANDNPDQGGGEPAAPREDLATMAGFEAANDP